MSKVESVLGIPINGVSQRDSAMRIDGRVGYQKNMTPSVEEGLISRPGSAWHGQLGAWSNNDIFVHHYKRASEHYQICAIHSTDKGSDEAIVVYDMAGVKQNVTIKSGDETDVRGYIETTDPRNKIRMYTIGDTTFVLNTSVLPYNTATGATAAYAQNEALVYVQNGAYGKNLRVFITPTSTGVEVQVALHATPDGSLATSAPEIATDFIASAVKTQLDSHALFSGGTYTATLENNLIHVEAAVSSNTFTLRTQDGSDSEDLVAISGSVRNIALLPPKPPVGFRILIEGDKTQDADDYWLQGYEYPTNSGNIVWLEIPAPSMRLQYVQGSMPMLLTRTGFTGSVANFELSIGDWIARDVGDDDTNPFPSFVGTTSTNGKPIKSMGMYQNRLYLAHSGDTMSLSRTNEFFSFFRTTTQARLATDAMELYSDSNQVSEIASSVNLDSDIILFSNAAQLRLDGIASASSLGTVLKPQGSYQNISSVQPVSNGNTVFFAYNTGDYSGVKEYFTTETKENKIAVSITDHVSKYIPGEITKLAVSGSSNMLAALCDGVLNKVFIYNWYNTEGDRVQAAWHTWEFRTDDVVIDIYFQDGIFYLIIDRGDADGTLSFESITLNDPPETGLNFAHRLDRKTNTIATKISDGVWRMTEPAYTGYDSELRYIRSTGAYDGEVGLDIYYDPDETYPESDLELADGVAGATITVVAGLEYESAVRPTLPVVKDFKGRVVSINKLIITQFWINYLRTGHITVSVENKYRDTNEIEFDGRYIGDPGNLVGAIDQDSNQFSFPVRLRADQTEILISTTDHFPLQIRSMEWRGQYTQRGRRI